MFGKEKVGFVGMTHVDQELWDWVVKNGQKMRHHSFYRYCRETADPGQFQETVE